MLKTITLTKKKMKLVKEYNAVVDRRKKYERWIQKCFQEQWRLCMLINEVK